MSTKRTRQKTITALGTKWVCKLLTDHEYDITYGNDSDAITMPATSDGDKNIIVFHESSFTLRVVRHELFHAYVYNLHLSSSKISVDDFEEIIAELLSVHADKFVIQSKEIYEQLSKSIEGGSEVRRRQRAIGSAALSRVSGDKQGAGVRSEEVLQRELVEGDNLLEANSSMSTSHIQISKRGVI
jgi:hypothetical protein